MKSYKCSITVQNYNTKERNGFRVEFDNDKVNITEAMSKAIVLIREIYNEDEWEIIAMSVSRLNIEE